MSPQEGDNGTASWLWITIHPIQPLPTLNAWEEGSHANDFGCPHATYGPASKPQTQDHSTLQVSTAPPQPVVLLPSLPMPVEQWLWNGDSTASSPPAPSWDACPGGMGGRHQQTSASVWSGGMQLVPSTNRVWGPHKQTPPSINPMRSTPGATRSCYKSQQLKGSCGGKTRFASLLGPGLCRDGDWNLPPEPSPGREQLSPAPELKGRRLQSSNRQRSNRRVKRKGSADTAV